VTLLFANEFSCEPLARALLIGLIRLWLLLGLLRGLISERRLPAEIGLSTSVRVVHERARLIGLSCRRSHLPLSDECLRIVWPSDECTAILAGVVDEHPLLILRFLVVLVEALGFAHARYAHDRAAAEGLARLTER